MRLKIFLIKGIFGLLFFILFAMVFLFFKKTGEKDSAEQARQVRSAVAALGEIKREISGFGTLSYVKKIDVAAAQDGTLGKLLYREGDAVKEGTLLAVLENPQITLAVGRAENNYAQAEAAVELARSRLLEGEFQAEARILSLEKAAEEMAQARRTYDEQERKYRDQEILYQAGGVPEETMRSSLFALNAEEEQIRLMEKELDIRRIGLREEDLKSAGLSVSREAPLRLRSLILLCTASLRAELAAAEARLDAAFKEMQSAKLAAAELSVMSPAAGIVGGRYFEKGERIKREDKILTLIDTRSLYAVFPVRETESLLLEKGMPARVKVDGTGGVYDGAVDLVAPAADSQSFTFSVRVLIAAGDPLKPGMFARVSIVLGPPRKAVMIPESSLVRKKNDEAAVFVVNGNILSERKVVLGEPAGEDREILSGLREGEVVVIKPDSGLKDGDYVSASD